MTAPADADPQAEQEMEACKHLVPRDEPEDELEALGGEVRARIDAERGPLAALRALPTWARIALVAALTGVVVVGTAVGTPRSDLAVYPHTRMAVVLALLGAVTAMAVWRLLRPLHLPRPSAWADRLLLVFGILAPVIIIVWPLHGHPGAPAGTGMAFVKGCLECLAFGGFLGIPILLFALALRRAKIDGPAVASLSGVAAAVTGMLALQVHCPITDPLHQLLGHASLLAVLGTAAVLWRRRESS